MARILLHTCCGPCTFYPLDRLRAAGWEVRGFFFNPNIHPYQEFQRRLEALQAVSEQESLPLIVRSDYPLEQFLRSVAFREGDRCLICYTLRLEAAARCAAKSRFDAFTTTLLYSKRQKHALARRIAENASKKYGIPFYYEDFREGWKAGQARAEKSGIYRQLYCGCIYSEKERFFISPSRRRTARKASDRFPAGGDTE